MGIVQENLVNGLRPLVEKKEYGSQFVKVVETNDVPTPTRVTKEYVPEKEEEVTEKAETKAPAKRGRSKKAK